MSRGAWIGKTMSAQRSLPLGILAYLARASAGGLTLNATTCTFNFPTTSGKSILVARATAGNSSNFTPTDNFSDIYVQDDRAGANFGANGTWLTLYLSLIHI